MIRPPSLAVLALLLLGSACTRLGHVGKPPDLTPVGEAKDAAPLTAQDVVSRLPVPAPPPTAYTTSSYTWSKENAPASTGPVRSRSSSVVAPYGESVTSMPSNTAGLSSRVIVA